MWRMLKKEESIWSENEWNNHGSCNVAPTFVRRRWQWMRRQLPQRLLWRLLLKVNCEKWKSGRGWKAAEMGTDSLRDAVGPPSPHFATTCKTPGPPWADFAKKHWHSVKSHCKYYLHVESESVIMCFSLVKNYIKLGLNIEFILRTAKNWDFKIWVMVGGLTGDLFIQLTSTLAHLSNITNHHLLGKLKEL